MVYQLNAPLAVIFVQFVPVDAPTLYLLFCQKIQYNFDTTVGDLVHMFRFWVRTYVNLRVKHLIYLKFIQKIAVTFLNNTVHDKDLLSVSLIAMAL